MMISKLVIVLIICSVFISCDKETKTDQSSSKSDKGTNEITESETDSVMTPEEIFSSSLVQDIIGDDEDIELQIYLEEQIYPLVSKSNKTTIDKISSSLYLLSYEESGVMKNFILQKFYNPVKDEFVFDKTETQINSFKQFVK
ncbi:MAG: hypothetical protein IPH77_09630 [Ignavibacteria bacterium]|nr:hypothetical protein [Ignavibacteria bacterium]MBK9405936.1 hypothetical protein [Ignavibacteria bacterium]